MKVYDPAGESKNQGSEICEVSENWRELVGLSMWTGMRASLDKFLTSVLCCHISHPFPMPHCERWVDVAAASLGGCDILVQKN